MILCCVFNGASSALFQNASGTAVASGTSGASALTGLSVGAQTADNGVNVFSEVAIFNQSHNAGQRSEVMRYMGARYGVVTS